MSLFKLTYQKKGESGWYSHPKTIGVSGEATNLLQALNNSHESETKYSLWEMDSSTGKWVKIATKENK